MRMQGGHGRLQAGREASPDTTPEQREESVFQLRRLWRPGAAPRARSETHMWSLPRVADTELLSPSEFPELKTKEEGCGGSQLWG